MIRMSKECTDKQQQLEQDIEVILKRIRRIHEEDLLYRNDLQNNLIDEERYTNECTELRSKIKLLSDQYEHLLENNIHGSKIRNHSLFRWKGILYCINQPRRECEGNLKSIQHSLESFEGG